MNVTDKDRAAAYQLLVRVRGNIPPDCDIDDAAAVIAAARAEGRAELSEDATHAGACRKAKAAENSMRIKATLTPIPIQHVSFMVLTLANQRERLDGESVAAARFRAFRELNTRWSKLRKRMARKYGDDLRFISTVEEHRSGWPHVNVIVVSEALGALCLSDGWLKSSVESNFDRELRAMVTECGFGRFTVEAARSKEALGQYIAKLASEVEAPAYRDATGRLVAEVAKITQAPVHAPRHFRALRSSKGFLVPKKKNEDWTGMMLDDDGIRAARGYVDRRWSLDAVTAMLAEARAAVEQAPTVDAREAAQARLARAEHARERVLVDIEVDKARAIELAATRRAECASPVGPNALRGAMAMVIATASCDEDAPPSAEHRAAWRTYLRIRRRRPARMR